MSVQKFKSICISACRKYLESVHSAALYSLTMAVPLEPVKPVIYARRLSRADTYSLLKYHSNFQKIYFL